MPQVLTRDLALLRRHDGLLAYPPAWALGSGHFSDGAFVEKGMGFSWDAWPSAAFLPIT